MKSNGWGWCSQCQHGTRDVKYSDVAADYFTNDYAGHNRDFTFLKTQHQTNVQLLQNYITGKEVLDVGFLEGAGIAAMSDAGFNVHGFDVSEAARVKAISNGIHESRLHVAPAFSPNLFDRQFNGVTCREVIEHVSNPDELLRNISRSLIAGGVAQIQTPVFDPTIRFWECEQHLRCYSVGSLITIAETSGLRFVDAKLWPGGMCLTFQKAVL
jgi:2-polyprenyl-3-methyl-5-hydroxy-6-metoxy-1,4-benzoquinol methylase